MFACPRLSGVQLVLALRGDDNKSQRGMRAYADSVLASQLLVECMRNS